MKKLKKKVQRRQRIKRGIRNKVTGTTERPRLTVFRSNKGIYAQIINDEVGHTVVAASIIQDGVEGASKVDQAREVGKKLAEKAAEHSITEVAFDRNGYLYHGRVQALAEGAREGGLKF